MHWWTMVGMALALLGAVPAGADTWETAKREVYEAAGKNVRFTVIPREISDRLDYFTDKVTARSRRVNAIDELLILAKRSQDVA